MKNKFKYDLCIIGGLGMVGLPLGILFAHKITMPIGPQSLDFNILNISVNPQVSDSDFVIQN